MDVSGLASAFASFIPGNACHLANRDDLGLRCNMDRREGANMDWNRWYSLKSYLRSSLWAVPLIAVAIYAVVKPLTEMLGRWMIRQAILDPKTGFLGLSMTGGAVVPR